MLKLTKIEKSYQTYNFVQRALKEVSISFRSNEFVAILGPSGSGKTTLLNIIGGLDHYDGGDLSIDGISTKKYKDSNWDTYRNSRIGFVFQSYNLIPHQSILANVELALTLSGVSKKERRERAIKALEEVDLKEHLNKLPSQLSGGQMQRVAIARALINDPEILLADEPTGALDTKTSLQVMDLLTQIAKDRLVIMVTHNPALADKYANRIVELKDGAILSDSNPYELDEKEVIKVETAKTVGMSFFTAISLSFKNLLTKKGRTFVTSLAGSIGIIGIAAILALASGINNYIASVEEETMSIYPLSIQDSGIDFSGLFSSTTKSMTSSSKKEEKGKVKEVPVMENMFKSQNKNDLTSLKAYLEKNSKDINPYVKSIDYLYPITPQIYLGDTSKGINQVNPDSLMSTFGMSDDSAMSAFMGANMASSMSSIFHQLPTESKMYQSQYKLEKGTWPQKYNEAVLVLMPDGSLSDYTLYSLGVKDRSVLTKMSEDFINKKEIRSNEEELSSPSYDTLLGASLKVVNAADRYAYDKTYGLWTDKSDNKDFMTTLIKNSMDLKIVGIVKAKPDAKATSLSPGVNYTTELVTHLMKEASTKEIVKAQLKDPTINVLSGKTFVAENKETKNSDFDLKDLIQIDENKIRNAFGMDPDKINLDLSSLADLSINTNNLSLPTMDIKALTTSLEGTLDIPTDSISNIVTNTMTTFLQDQINSGITDPEEILANMKTYFGSTEVQNNISSELSLVLKASGLENQIETLLNTYISENLENYIQIFTDEIRTQLSNQIEEKMSALMAQLPASLQNALTIDTTAFADAFKMNLSEDEIYELMTAMMKQSESTSDKNLIAFGYANEKSPSQINLYPKDFNAKNSITTFLTNYNKQMEKEKEEDKTITYTDLVGTMMSSVTDIVDTISYALVAFVSISLVVSSIMIGVITYISVLERKKEIGILRAIGASKRDIRRVFNAETLMIGFGAGLIGVVATYLLSIIANIIVYNKLNIKNIAHLPFKAALILVLISMFLAFISGLFPASAAARKDPVEALRSE